MPAECCKKFWERIPEDVPVFTIVAYDALSENTVKAWLELAKANGVNAEKIALAEKHLIAIQDWQMDNPEKIKIPD